MIIDHSRVGWGCRIHWLHLCKVEDLSPPWVCWNDIKLQLSVKFSLWILENMVYAFITITTTSLTLTLTLTQVSKNC